MLQTSGGGIGGTGGGAGAIGGAMHHSGSGSGSHTPMDIDEGIEIPPEKVNKLDTKKLLVFIKTSYLCKYSNIDRSSGKHTCFRHSVFEEVGEALV